MEKLIDISRINQVISGMYSSVYLPLESGMRSHINNAGTHVNILSHTKSGSVHQLSGLGNPTSAVCIFKATSNYISGDTFTVDGVTYSTQMMDGSLIPSNMFVSGAQVLCVIDGISKKINFKSGGGLSLSDLALATATPADVLGGKTFYAGNGTLKTGTRSSGTIQFKHDLFNMLSNSTQTVSLDFDLGWYFVWSKQKTTNGPRSKFVIDGRVGLVDTEGYEGHGDVVNVSTSNRSVTFKTYAYSVEIEYYFFGNP